MKKLLMLALVAAFAAPMAPSFAAPVKNTQPEAQSPSAGSDAATSDEGTGTDKMTHKGKKHHGHKHGMHGSKTASKSDKKTDGSETK